MSIDLSSEVTAIATVVLAAFAFITAILASLAFWKQLREVHDQAQMLKVESEELAEQRKLNAEQAKVLELQAADLRESLEERKREADEQHRAQAARVFIGASRDSAYHVTAVVNLSDLPAYDAQIWYSSNPDSPYTVGTVLPGERAHAERARQFRYPRKAIEAAVLTFRDAAGVRWVRTPDGTLSEQSHDAAQESVLAALGTPIPEQIGHEDQERPDIPG
jgi:hypothetical protein